MDRLELIEKLEECVEYNNQAKKKNVIYKTASLLLSSVAVAIFISAVVDVLSGDFAVKKLAMLTFISVVITLIEPSKVSASEEVEVIVDYLKRGEDYRFIGNSESFVVNVSFDNYSKVQLADEVLSEYGNLIGTYENKYGQERQIVLQLHQLEHDGEVRIVEDVEVRINNNNVVRATHTSYISLIQDVR